jgi:hypothetical protein
LGQNSVMDPSCQHNFLGHQQPQGHNRQESTTFILPYGSNKQSSWSYNPSPSSVEVHIGLRGSANQNSAKNGAFPCFAQLFSQRKSSPPTATCTSDFYLSWLSSPNGSSWW